MITIFCLTYFTILFQFSRSTYGVVTEWEWPLRTPGTSALVCLIFSVYLPSSPHFLRNSSPSFSLHKSAGSFVPFARTHRHSRPGLVLVHLSLSCTHVHGDVYWKLTVCFAPLKTLHKLAHWGMGLTLHYSIRLDLLRVDLLESTQIIWVTCTGKYCRLQSGSAVCWVWSFDALERIKDSCVNMPRRVL